MSRQKVIVLSVTEQGLSLSAAARRHGVSRRWVITGTASTTTRWTPENGVSLHFCRKLAWQIGGRDTTDFRDSIVDVPRS